MKKTLLLFLIFLATQYCIAQSLTDGIDAADAADLELNTKVVIKDKISQVVKKKNEFGKWVIYVNFGNRWPRNSFTLLINEENFRKFPDIFKLKNKFVEVEGITRTYRYYDKGAYFTAPCIILTDTNQLN